MGDMQAVSSTSRIGGRTVIIGGRAVNGVERETIEAIDNAARREGASLGDWVNRVLGFEAVGPHPFDSAAGLCPPPEYPRDLLHQRG